MGKAWHAPRIIVAIGVVMATEATLRPAHPRHDTRFISLDERVPIFAATPASGLSGAARERAREGCSLELHHPCAVDEPPRPAHLALARLQAALELRGKSVTVVADAIEGLHERSGLRGVIHAQGLRCRECGRVEDHRADLGLSRGADCPTYGARKALWRHEPFWTGGRLSRGDGVSDVSRLREAVGAAHGQPRFGGGQPAALAYMDIQMVTVENVELGMADQLLLSGPTSGRDGYGLGVMGHPIVPPRRSLNEERWRRDVDSR